MKKISLLSMKFIIMFLVAAVVFTNCKKDDDDDDDNNNNNNQTATTPNTTPEFEDGDAVLVALKSTSFTSVSGYDIETVIGMAVGAFPDAANSGSFLDAGSITCEGKELTKYTNNSYLFSPTATDYTGISFSSNVQWEVSGNSANSIDPISQSVSIGWPTVSKIKDNPSTINTSADFTLEADGGISNADSVIFALYGGTGDPLMVTKAGASSHTFTAAEMSGLTGSGFAQIVAYKYMTGVFGSKNIYFVNEAVVSNMVTYQ